MLKGARREDRRAPAILASASTSSRLASDYSLPPSAQDHYMKRGISRPARLPHLLRSRRRRPFSRLRPWAWRQSFELVAAGAAFPRPLHLRDLRASRLCAVERASRAAPIQPTTPAISRRWSIISAPATCASSRNRWAAGARSNMRSPTGPRARAGAGLDRRHDRARAVAVRRSRSNCPRGNASAAAAAAANQANNIHVAGGERLAREQPAAHFLYQEIDALSGVDKSSCARSYSTGSCARLMRCAR